MPSPQLLQQIPSVDKLLGDPALAELLETYGHTRIKSGLQELLAQYRKKLREMLHEQGQDATPEKLPDTTEITSKLALQQGRVQGRTPTTDNTTEFASQLALQLSRQLAAEDLPSLKPVHNLTGVVLHTNLGRASLPRAALASISKIAEGASNLEYDLETGLRGDRDSHLESLVIELTGAEAATLVNNNAAAVLLCLNTLAQGRQVCVSRGELVEIGGSFRIPDIMERSGCQLREVGTTNRTHLKDYANAIDSKTAALMKVHTSNYAIQGFTSAVSWSELAKLAHEHNLPCLADLGSGNLVDLSILGLAAEPRVAEVLQDGVDLVTFSGDKLLGGPQAGIIAGRAELVAQLKHNPLKRALRLGKLTIAALTAVLQLYRSPELLARTIPSLGQLARSTEDIDARAQTVLPAIKAYLADQASVEVVDCQSQVGSGALPLSSLASRAICITPAKPYEASLQKLARQLRELPVPVIGRLQDGKLLLDMRTLDDPAELVHQLEQAS